MLIGLSSLSGAEVAHALPVLTGDVEHRSAGPLLLKSGNPLGQTICLLDTFASSRAPFARSETSLVWPAEYSILNSRDDRYQTLSTAQFEPITTYLVYRGLRRDPLASSPPSPIMRVEVDGAPPLAAMLGIWLSPEELIQLDFATHTSLYDLYDSQPKRRGQRPILEKQDFERAERTVNIAITSGVHYDPIGDRLLPRQVDGHIQIMEARGTERINLDDAKEVATHGKIEITGETHPVETSAVSSYAQTTVRYEVGRFYIDPRYPAGSFLRARFETLLYLRALAYLNREVFAPSAQFYMRRAMKGHLETLGFVWTASSPVDPASPKDDWEVEMSRDQLLKLEQVLLAKLIAQDLDLATRGFATAQPARGYQPADVLYVRHFDPGQAMVVSQLGLIDFQWRPFLKEFGEKHYPRWSQGSDLLLMLRGPELQAAREKLRGFLSAEK